MTRIRVPPTIDAAIFGDSVSVSAIRPTSLVIREGGVSPIPLGIDVDGRAIRLQYSFPLNPRARSRRRSVMRPCSARQLSLQGLASEDTAQVSTTIPRRLGGLWRINHSIAIARSVANSSFRISCTRSGAGVAGGLSCYEAF